MNSSRHRHTVLSALAVLITAAGCSPADDSASVAVPRPDAKVTELCQNLDEALPAKVDGESRDDPEPASELTAGWGGVAIILRCGVERPPKMADPKVANGSDADAVPGGVNGVDWLMETPDDVQRFTTANREAYVEVEVADGRDSTGVLIDLAPALKKAIPDGIAS
ncbi:DUF3515 domain-containing protein [Streptomyces sp. NPDC000348]|uniref:DUF3515 domain-containing protein n=1 Tax=Streptomyces sp. NPDC000348 TaxID=3364538 RepID=UPI003681078F